MLKTAAEGAAEGVLGPIAPLIETKVLGVDPEDIRARAEVNPAIRGGSEAAAFVGSLLTGTGEARLMTEAGKAAAKAVGLGAEAIQGASLAAKIGSSAVSNAAEMAVMQSGDEVSKMILQDPNTAAESSIANIGLASVLGGVAGGGLTGLTHGVISPLWQASAGPKVEGALKSLKSRLNGESASTLVKEAEDLGLTKMTADIEGALSDSPTLKNAASGLRQTDTSRVARAFQEREREFKEEVLGKMSETLGKNADALSTLEVSEANYGKELGESLVKDYKAKIDPIIKELEEAKSKFATTPLEKDTVSVVQDLSNPYKATAKEAIKPGTTSSLRDKIMTKAGEEGWLADKLSPEARFIKTTMKELGNKETLQDLVKFGQNIGQSTKSTLPFGMQTPLSRAGAIVRDIIRDAENDMIVRKLGMEAPELVAKFRGALSEFKDLAALKDALNDRLKIGGSVSGFAKGLSEMAKTDSETLIRRLSGSKDANLLNFMAEHFPDAAQKIRQYHVDKILEKSTKDGVLNAPKLMKQIEAMSPELREFAIGPQGVEKVGRLNEFLTKLHDQKHNFSNTARTVDTIMSGGSASAMGMIAALMGNTGLGLAIPLAEIAGKEGVAATRLGMLKFLGSSQPVKSEGFKAMIGHIDAIYKQEHFLNKAVKNVFKGSAQVLTSNQMPNEADRTKLDKIVTKLQDKPAQLINNEEQGHLGHYMPDQQTAIAAASTKALQYLQSIKPQPHLLGPLDKPVPPQPSELARYDRALNIATQPNIVLEHVKNGTLLPSDIQDLHSMFPGLYQQMSNKLTNMVADQHGAEEPIPYKTRIGISLFLGQPLDATMSPASIQAAQPLPMQGPQQPQQKPKAKNAPSALGKNIESYQTPLQGAESDRSSRK